MAEPNQTRPSLDQYFMGIAMAVRKRANCKGSRVGAVVVVGRHIVSTGYNGTPANMTNCNEGGCYRCANRDKFPPGTGYDLCICVHAEQNAILTAARYGIAIEGATVYTTMRPCFGCTKEMLQAKVDAVYFLHNWNHPDDRARSEYEKLQARFPGGIRQIQMDDPEEFWAVSAQRPAAEVPARVSADPHGSQDV